MGVLSLTRHKTRSSTRVLAVIDTLEVGGAQHHLLGLARGLVSAGGEVLVATSANEPMASDFRAGGVPVWSLTPRSIKHEVSPTFARRLSHLAASGDFDLIHAHLYSSSVAAYVAARLTGLPLVVTHHSMNTWQCSWQRWLGRWVDRSAEAVIAVSSNVAAAHANARVHTILNGVELPEQRWSAAEIAAARSKLGIPKDAYTVCFVGRFSADKNPLLFVEMAAAVAATDPTVHFLLMGDGPLRPMAELRTAALGLGERIHFVGFQPEAKKLLQAADVLAVTSQSEGSPLVTLEAMAAARPVVATNVGDIARQVVDGEAGYVVRPGDARALAARILALRDPALRERMGARGLARVRRSFHIKHALDQTFAIYREVLGEPEDRLRLTA
jgi:glycosyltransferase involved in cell wall biosynthesis